MSTNLRPLYDHVIVERKENETKTASGIVIPDNAAEKPDQGVVIAVGKGKVLDDGSVRKPEVKVGDVVWFEKYAPRTIKVGNKELLIIKEEQIMAIDESKAPVAKAA